MKTENEIRTIEYTLRNIFNKDEIRMIDVVAANSLFDKWKELTGYTEDDKFPVKHPILDEEPNWITKN